MRPDILKLLAASQDGVFAVDMSQRIVFWNKSAERLLEFRTDEVLRKRCYQVFIGSSEREAPACFRNCTAIISARCVQIPSARTIRFRSPSGETKWVSVTHLLLPGSKNETDSLVHILHDITEEVGPKDLLRRLEDLLSRAPQTRDSSSLSAQKIQNSSPVLSTRELEVAGLLAQGLGTKAIAGMLVISPTTVRNHIQRILFKLGVHTRLEAVATITRQGLL